MNNYDQVNQAAQELRQIAQEVGDRWWEGISLSYLSMTLLVRQKPNEAKRVGEEALEIFAKEIGEYFELTWAALVLGSIALTLGNYEEAKHLLQRSLNAAETINYRRTIQQCYDNLGDVALFLDEFKEAEKYFRLSLKVSEETGMTREMLDAL